jgi:hypothetical protein
MEKTIVLTSSRIMLLRRALAGMAKAERAVMQQMREGKGVIARSIVTETQQTIDAITALDALLFDALLCKEAAAEQAEQEAEVDHG